MQISLQRTKEKCLPTSQSDARLEDEGILLWHATYCLMKCSQILKERNPADIDAFPPLSLLFSFFFCKNAIPKKGGGRRLRNRTKPAHRRRTFSAPVLWTRFKFQSSCPKTTNARVCVCVPFHRQIMHYISMRLSALFLRHLSPSPCAVDVSTLEGGREGAEGRGRRFLAAATEMCDAHTHTCGNEQSMCLQHTHD